MTSSVFIQVILEFRSKAKNPMAISYSNAGDQHSVILNSLKARAEAAIAGNNDAIGWFEWSAPDVEIGDTPEFWDAVRYSNPSLGYTVHPDNLRAILNDDESTIKTEVLCRWVNVQNPAINPSAWEAIADKKIKASKSMVSESFFQKVPIRAGNAEKKIKKHLERIYICMYICIYQNGSN